jgi:hypothetical protein
MPGLGKTAVVPGSAGVSPARNQAIYRRYAVALYRQALLNLVARRRPGMSTVTRSSMKARWRRFRSAVPALHDIAGQGSVFPTESRRKMMRALGYATAITLAAAGTALGVLAVKALPEMRRYVAMRRM